MLKNSIKLLLTLVLLLPNYTALAASDPATVSTFAGQGVWGDKDGAKEEARFRLPTYATVDQQGNIYVADTQNHLIRQIDTQGRVTSLAGQTNGYDDYGLPVGGYQDGSFSEALFKEPRGLAVANNGSLYVADSQNGGIRVLVDGIVSTLVDELDYPSDVVITDTGDLYVTETLQHRIIKVSMDGEVTVVAGGGYTEEDGWLVGGLRDGQGLIAQFNEPTGLALGEDGTLYIADTGNQRIRALSPNGTVTTIAGSGTERMAETGYIVGGFQDGLARQAQFNYPSGLAIDTDGTIYVADTFNHKVRQITSSGVVQTVTGLDTYGHQNGPEVKASLDQPTDVLVLPNSNLFVVDRWNHALRVLEWYHLPPGVEQDGSIHVVWNQHLITFDTQVKNVEGRIMVPVRALAETFGYEVGWDQVKQTVSFRSGDHDISLQIGSTEVTGTKELTMDVAPFIKDNRTFVPVRFVAEAFDKDVRWLETTQTVLIRD